MSFSENPPEDQLSSLLQHYQAGRLSDAEKLAIDITQEFPKHQFAWKILGAILIANGRNSEALDANQKTIELSPQDPEAHYNLGITLKALGRLDEAIASYKQAIALKPDYAKAHNNLGNTFQELGRLEEALASCTQAIALNPDYAKAHSNLGVTLQELGRLEEALASYKQAIALKSDFAESHYNLGNTLQELVRLEEALASYQRAIELKPNHTEANLNVGILYKKMGEFEKAANNFRKVLAVDPDNQQVRYNLGSVLENEAKFQYHQAFERADTKSKLESLNRNLKKFVKKDIQINEKISYLLNQLSQAINKLCGIRHIQDSGVSVPLINTGPCGIFANQFYRLWDLRFSNKIKIAAVIKKQPIESNHVLIKLPNDALFDGGNGIHEFDTYDETRVELVVMEKYDLEILDKYAWGLIRTYPNVNHDFSIGKMSALIASCLDDIYKA